MIQTCSTEIINVKIKTLNENAVIPFYKHKKEDMGMDITVTSVEYDYDKDRFIYHTGLAFQLPTNFGMLIFPRSSNTKTDAYLANSVGILDSGYIGELLIIYKLRTSRDVLFPSKSKELVIEEMTKLAPYKVGDRAAQIVILPYPQVEFTKVDEFEQTSRGDDGGLKR